SLPPDRIAAYPLAERDASKLLVYRDGVISASAFTHLAALIPSHSLMIFNDTRVVEARLLFQKPTGARIEIFCLEHGPAYPDISKAMVEQGQVTWKCLVGNAASWTPGLILEKKINRLSGPIILHAELSEKLKDHFLVNFSWSPAELTFAALLHEAGLIPLPPYIKRKAESDDAERYQTIYAHDPGSVAAPTAGLHFTPALEQQLEEKNIQRDYVTLHVGAGTFKPVKTALVSDHEMHAEWISAPRKTIENIYTHLHKHITAVGTTSFRTLESLYWIGVKLAANPSAVHDTAPAIEQWIAYGNYPSLTTEAALETVLKWMDKNKLDTLSAKTSLLAMPGYHVRIPHALITNFHQPKSTLLLLVAALIGEEWKNVYRYALDHEFRFLSYGDGCLLFRP
ncbi:MAG: S-adenosylmethionine:tRNA ribosyltransferase-isomerase, partial [Flavitalea sp.]